MYKSRSYKKFGLIALLLVGVFGGAVYFANGYIAAFLWDHQMKAAAYYVNYSNTKVALNQATYYFGGDVYNLEKAKKSYQLALNLDPKSPLARYQLARIYFVEGDFTNALQEINTELVENPQNLRALYVRALIEMTQGDLPLAENDFRRFVQWAPTEWGGYNDLAYVEAKEGKYAQSQKTIEEAMQKVFEAEQVPWLWNSLGLAQLNQFKYQEAATSFKKALDLANVLTEEEWRRAYTANDPAGDVQSIVAFRRAIADNLAKAQSR